MASSNPVMGAISSNAADLSGQQQDLSVQAFTNIFGEGWWNLINASGNETLIYKLLETLNACCAIVVAWLMIFTVLIASVGSAQEGRSIGGQYASAWVPLRFSFSFAAITPVFNGLCAMQILILACIGVSIDLANSMFNTGVKWISEKREISAVLPPKLTGVGQQLAVGAVESQVLINYLTQQAKCEGLSGTALKRVETGSDSLYLFQVPNGGQMTCGGYTIKVKENSLGGFKIPKGTQALDNAKGSALSALLEKTDPLAQKIGELKPDYGNVAEILQAGKTYSKLAYDASKGLLEQQNQANLEKAAKEFQDIAQTRGWFTLGSYYWALANAAQKSMDALSDSTSYIKPDLTQFQVALHGSWNSNVQSNLIALQAAARNPVSLTSEMEYNSVSALASEDGLGSLGKYFYDFNTLYGEGGASLPGANQGAYAASAAEWLNGPDAIISTVQLARKVVNICAGSMIAVEAAKLVAIGTGESAKGSWIGELLSVGTGANKGIGEAIKQGAKDVAFIAMLALGSLWVFATFVAYIVPAMPYLIWMAALVGWIVLCLEATIAAPLWLIGHAMPEGQGFAGQHGRTGYLLILSILVRPLLLVISLFLAMIIMQATGALIQSLFSPFTVSMQTFGGWGNALGPVGAIFLFILLSGTIALFTWKIFALVTAMPDRIIRWVGQNIQNLGDEGRTAAGNDVIGSTSKQGQRLQGMAGAATGGVGGLKGAYVDTPMKMQQMRNQAAEREAIMAIAAASKREAALQQGNIAKD